MSWYFETSAPVLQVYFGGLDRLQSDLNKVRQLWEGRDRNVVCHTFRSIVMTEMACRNLCTSMALQSDWQTERWDLWSHLDMAKMDKPVPVCYKVPVQAEAVRNGQGSFLERFCALLWSAYAFK